MNLVTVYPGPEGHTDQFLMSIYNRLAANPPAGYSATLHADINDLCQQITNAGSQLEVLEVVSHGNPYFLGVITVDVLKTLGTTLGSCPSAQVYLSGCNTGTYNQGATPSDDISAMLAAATPCPIYGSLGYLNDGTYAEGTVECSADDWGQEKGMVYEGAARPPQSGANAFTLKAKPTIGAMVPRHSPPQFISINNPGLPATTRAAMQALIAQLIPANVHSFNVNHKTAPNVTISATNQMYELYFDGRYVRQKSNNATWMVSLSPDQTAALTTLWVPRPGTAVVPIPTPVPSATSPT